MTQKWKQALNFAGDKSRGFSLITTAQSAQPCGITNLDVSEDLTWGLRSVSGSFHGELDALKREPELVQMRKGNDMSVTLNLKVFANFSK